jgi:hypothetical protein
MFLALELCLAVILGALAYIFPRLGESRLTAIERKASKVTPRGAGAVITVGLLALSVRLVLLPIEPVPQPKVQDEFSFLLLADTLAHGRLANPTHPMWVHFETFQVNWQPTYASMYYPGYGLFLALGQQVMGHPFWGVWLSSGLMCAALCWAFQGWLSPGWAFLGGLLAVIRLGAFSYWANSYWGGTVAAIGGALVLGAFPRIKRKLGVRDSLLLALGMATIACTRPYEGLFLCVPVLLTLLSWLIGKNPLPWQSRLVRIALPIGLVMTLALAFLGYYFWRVTGSPFTTPYQVNMRTYGLVYFPWEKVRPVPEFHHQVMRMFYRGASVVGWYDFAHLHPLKLQGLKALVIWLFYFGPALTLPWIAWLLTRPKARLGYAFAPELRFLLLLCVCGYTSVVFTIYIGQPHYLAHLTALYYLLLLLMLRDLYGGGPGERFLARAVPLLCFLLLAARIAAPLVYHAPKPSWIRTWCSQDEQNLERARILRELERQPGNHLVIVRYQANHDFILDEWVFNNADIDGSKVVWARDMGPRNEELLRYFSGRTAWLVEPDYNPARLTPYGK